MEEGLLQWGAVGMKWVFPQVLTNLSSWLLGCGLVDLVPSHQCWHRGGGVLLQPMESSGTAGHRSAQVCSGVSPPAGPSSAMVFQCEMQSGRRAAGQAGLWCG